MALAWWRLAAVLAHPRAALLAGLVAAASAGAAMAWPSPAAAGATGPLGLFRLWSAASWVAALAVSVWAAHAGESQEAARRLGSGAGEEAEEGADALFWEDWHRLGGLGPEEVAAGLALSAWAAGLGAAALALPPGLFAAAASGATAADVALAVAVAGCSAAAGSAWGTAAAVGLPEGARGIGALVALAGIAGVAAVALRPAPFEGAALVNGAAAARLAAILAALAAAGAVPAAGAVRRRLRALAREEGGP